MGQVPNNSLRKHGIDGYHVHLRWVRVIPLLRDFLSFDFVCWSCFSCSRGVIKCRIRKFQVAIDVCGRMKFTPHIVLRNDGVGKTSVVKTHRSMKSMNMNGIVNTNDNVISYMWPTARIDKYHT